MSSEEQLALVAAEDPEKTAKPLGMRKNGTAPGVAIGEEKRKNN